MQLIVQLDTESTRQLTAIQGQTNQDHNTVIQQAISLYYQQIQSHCRVHVEDVKQYELVGNGIQSVSAIN